MKIGPDVWGPHGWKFMHMIALAYPLTPTNEQKLHYREFFTVLQYILPCSICANNYAYDCLCDCAYYAYDCAYDYACDCAYCACDDANDDACD